MKNIVLLIVILFITYTNNANIALSKPLAAYKIDSLWYIIDTEGKGIFNPLEILYVAGYSEGFYRIYLESEEMKIWAFMNDNGNVAVPMCDEIRPFRDGMAMISDIVDKESEFRLFGFIDTSGKMIVGKHYLDATDYSEGLAWIMNKQVRGYVNKTGKLVIPWDTSGFGSQFSEGLAAMTNSKERFGFINKKGEVVIDFQYDEVSHFVDGLARVNILAKWGFIDKNNNLVIPANYDYAFDFVEGFCFVGAPDPETLEPKWGIINRGGGIVVPISKYDEVRNFNQGIGAVREGSDWKYIDYLGNQLIRKNFTNAEEFRDGLAWVTYDDVKGFIDPTGEMVIQIPKEAEIVVDLRLNKMVK
jgi:hypothetical protein